MLHQYGPSANNPLIQDVDPDAIAAYRRHVTDAVTNLEWVKEQVAEICARTLETRSLSKELVWAPEDFNAVLDLLGEVYGMLNTLHADREIDDIDRLATLADLVRVREQV